ncbi:integrase [Gossypium australe]|uniref:Integrase n=1 Tax=Gossypium australe TaxID=47621 RepID=A0A5B6VP02_9ROSI|nr:integrase [Gossypium australe]
MYNDLKQMYWWPGMKCEIYEFVPKCLVCQQVKAEHQVPSTYNDYKVETKMSHNDFVSGLPLTPTKKYVI